MNATPAAATAARAARTNGPLRLLRLLLALLGIGLITGGALLLLAPPDTVLEHVYGTFTVGIDPRSRAISVAVLRQLAALLILLGAGLLAMARDPIRHRPVLLAFLAGLVVVALTPLRSFYELGLARTGRQASEFWVVATTWVLLAAFVLMLLSLSGRRRP